MKATGKQDKGAVSYSVANPDNTQPRWKRHRHPMRVTRRIFDGREQTVDFLTNAMRETFLRAQDSGMLPTDARPRKYRTGVYGASPRDNHRANLESRKA